jgi:hypothetical protein
LAQDRLGGHTLEIADHGTQLNVGTLEYLLEAIGKAGALLEQAQAIAGEIP